RRTAAGAARGAGAPVLRYVVGPLGEGHAGGRLDRLQRALLVQQRRPSPHRGVKSDRAVLAARLRNGDARRHGRRSSNLHAFVDGRVDRAVGARSGDRGVLLRGERGSDVREVREPEPEFGTSALVNCSRVHSARSRSCSMRGTVLRRGERIHIRTVMARRTAMTGSARFVAALISSVIGFSGGLTAPHFLDAEYDPTKT